MALIITQAGLAALATAESTGSKLQATHMAVGDGNGQPVSHTSQSVELLGETWRGELQEIKVVDSGEVEFIAHIPFAVGGWYMREAAIYAADTLLAIGSHPEVWKPAPEAPDKVELLVTAPVKFTNTDVINLTVDTTKVLASQEMVVSAIAQHNEDDNAHAGALAGAVAHIVNKNNPHGVTLDQTAQADPDLLRAVNEPYLPIVDEASPAIDPAARNRFKWSLAADRTFPAIAPLDEGEWHFNVYPSGHTLTLDAAWNGLNVGEPDPTATMIRLALVNDGVSLTLYVDNKGV